MLKVKIGRTIHFEDRPADLSLVCAFLDKGAHLGFFRHRELLGWSVVGRERTYSC